MLILTRRIGETILVGDDVRITIAGVNRHQVRLSIDAPRAVPVHREEVYDRIKAAAEAEPAH